MIIIPSNCAAAIPSDPYWNSVSLLVKDLGINGATNNSFYDDGPYKFLPARTGDVTQGSFSPFGPLSGTADPTAVGGSVWFNGSGNYLTAPSPSGRLGSGDFTFETWVYPVAKLTSNPMIWHNYGLNWGAGGIGLFAGFGTDTTKYVFICDNTIPALKSTSDIVYNSWTHIAIVRSSGVIKLYINGVSEGGTFSNSSTLNIGDGSSCIGTNLGDKANGYFCGNISNTRIVSGTAVYTAAFKPPTAPLTAIAGTSLLTCQSSSAISDASSNALAVTRFGDARPVSDSPFGWGSARQLAIGDYLKAPSSSAFAFGTGDFTVEMWYWSDTDLNSANKYLYSAGGSPSNVALQIYNGAVYFYHNNATAITGSLSGNGTSAYKWHHIALVRSGTMLTIYVNGVQVATGSSSYNFTENTCYIGSSNGGGAPLTGYISNFRVVKGTAVYAGSFTPPMAPLTAITGTSLLTCQDKGSIVDASTNSFAVSRVGDAKPVGMTPFAQKQAGYWSADFPNGSVYGSYSLAISDSPALRLGSGDFTIEYWLKESDLTSWGGHAHFAKDNATPISGQFARLWVGAYGGVPRLAINNDYQYVSTGQYTVGSWNHIAWVRSGTTLTCYLNGVNVSSFSSFTWDLNFDGPVWISKGRSDNAYCISGSMSNLRVVKGTAVYTGNFTPPTAPLTAIPGTSLLTLQDNRFRDNSPNNFTVTPTGSPTVSLLNPFGPSLPAPTVNLASAGSVYFDGSGDVLTVPSSSAFGFGTEDFTVETWVSSISYNSVANILVDFRNGGDPQVKPCLEFNNGTIALRVNGTNVITGNYVPLNAWTHIAICRSGGVTRLFINGVQAGSSYTDSNNYGTSGPCWVGVDNDGSPQYYLNGYVSNLRVVKGTGIYSSNFTPSTSPLTAISGTSLLTAQDAVTVTDASSNGFTVTKVGDAKAVEASPFKRVSTVYGGSGYFDGSGDYLSMNKTSYTDFGTGNFTIDGWFYTNVTSRLDIAGQYYSSTATGWGLALGVNSTRDICFYNGNSVILASSGNAWSPGCWNHFAVVRNGTNLSTYINGVSVASTTYSTDISHPSSPYVYVGWGGGSGGPVFNGYLSNFRIVKGVAVYTANFTPPTAPVSAVGGTSLLLNFDNAGIYDASGNQNINAVDAKTDKTVVKYSAASTNVTVNNNVYMYGAKANDFAFGTGDFTIEGWCKLPDGSAHYIYDGRPLNTNGAYPAIVSDAGTRISYVANGASQIVGSFVPTDWNHIAVSRNSGNTRMFINGTQVGSTYADTTNYLSAVGRPVLFGYGYSTNQFSGGNFEDFRVTKGVARYTANFTPPAVESPTRQS